MPSRDKRVVIESALHAAATVLLVLLIWKAVHASGERSTVRASSADVRRALAQWSTREAPSSAHVTFDSLPDPVVRDWLHALPSTGTETSWEGARLTASALNVEPIVDPKHSVRIWVAAPSGSGVIVRDTLGIIDSVFVRSAGGVLNVPRVEGTVHATVLGSSATAVGRDSLVVRPVLLLGTASWEGKFVLAALEEHGWTVEARLAVAPRNDVVQGVARAPAPLSIDTARYAAVLALDSVAARYAAAIIEYVRRGGGLVTAGEAASLAAFDGILPGKTTTALQSGSFAIDSAEPRRALALQPIAGLKSGALPIETRDGHTAVAARRFSAGRVLQVGYVDTWRWRMGGVDDPVAGHRDWWSAMVSSVAYAPRIAQRVTTVVEPTPVATLVGTLGAPTPQVQSRTSLLDDPRLLPALFAFLMTMLVAEWASRRLRGRP
jgi:hypothetical protein